MSAEKNGPDPEILRHNLRNAMQAVEGLRNRIKVLEEQLVATQINPLVASFDHLSLKDRERLIAALVNGKGVFSLEQPTMQWRPIEAAPRDGMWILLSHPQVSWIIAQWRHDIGQWIEQRTGFTVTAPTHWMSLPQPPKPPTACTMLLAHNGDGSPTPGCTCPEPPK